MEVIYSYYILLLFIIYYFNAKNQENNNKRNMLNGKWHWGVLINWNDNVYIDTRT